MAEASRFGILNTNEDDSIYEFDEKPKKPKSDLANIVPLYQSVFFRFS